MRKILLSFLLITMFFATPVFAENVNVIFNGETMSFPDPKPFINTDSRTVVPLRFISETMGAAVDWDAHTKTVSIAQDGTNIELRIGADHAIKNGERIGIDTNAIIYYDRTFVPLRFVSEVLGATVDWNANTKTVIITKDVPKEEEPVVEVPPAKEEEPKIDVPTTDFEPTNPGEVPEEKLSKEHYHYYEDRAIETIQYENDVFSIRFPELPAGYYYGVSYTIIDNLGNWKQELVFFRNIYAPTWEGAIIVEKDGILEISTADIQTLAISIGIKNGDDIGLGSTSIRFPSFEIWREGEAVGNVSDYQK